MVSSLGSSEKIGLCKYGNEHSSSSVIVQFKSNEIGEKAFDLAEIAGFSLRKLSRELLEVMFGNSSCCILVDNLP